MPRRIALLAALSLAGCAYPSEAERFVREGDAWFSLRSFFPADGAVDQPRNPLVRLTFSDFPDPGTIGAIAVRVGREERRCGTERLSCEVDLIARQVVLRPLLGEGDAVEVEAGAEVRSLAGVALGAAQIARFRAGAMMQVVPGPTPITLAELVGDKGRLRTACGLVGACHGSTASQPAARGLDVTLPLPELQKALTTLPGRGSPERLLLVEPGQPERSYLLRKMLAHDGFVRAEGDPMPPGGRPASLDGMLQAVSDWIRLGAKL